MAPEGKCTLAYKGELRGAKEGFKKDGLRTPASIERSAEAQKRLRLARCGEHAGTTAKRHGAACGKTGHKIRIAHAEEAARVVADEV